MSGTRAGAQEPVIRGVYQVPLPWDLPVVRTAQDGVGFAPACHRMHSGQHWVVLYFHTRTLLRVGRPSRPWLTLPENTAALIPAYQDYWLDTRGGAQGAAIHHSWVTLQQIEKTPLMAMLQNATGLARFRDDSGVLARLIETVVAAGERFRLDAFWPMQYALRPLLHSLIKARPVEQGLFEISERPASSLAETLVPGVVGYLQTHMGEGVSTGGLARYLRLSVSSVSHTYRKVTGETPMQTLRRLRIQQLKSHLVQGWSLDAAAQAVGFYDGYHASREFKKTEGLSPSAFISRLRDLAA